MLSVQCPYCDSLQVKMISLSSYKCEYCGRSFSLEETEKPLVGFDV